MFEGFATPFYSSPPRSDPSSRPTSPSGSRSNGGFELGGPSDTIDGTKEERRFLALNPRGTLDFALPSEGNFGDYFGESIVRRIYTMMPFSTVLLCGTLD